jgi:hypothetical protein
MVRIFGSDPKDEGSNPSLPASFDAGSSNGRARDFEARYVGSIPTPAANCPCLLMVGSLILAQAMRVQFPSGTPSGYRLVGNRYTLRT